MAINSHNMKYFISCTVCIRNSYTMRRIKTYFNCFLQTSYMVLFTHCGNDLLLPKKRRRNSSLTTFSPTTSNSTVFIFCSKYFRARYRVCGNIFNSLIMNLLLGTYKINTSNRLKNQNCSWRNMTKKDQINNVKMHPNIYEILLLGNRKSIRKLKKTKPLELK